MMRSILAVVLLLGLSPAAWADSTCDNGKPGIFTFVKWQMKASGKDRLDINMTFHNTLDQALSDASFGVGVFDGGGTQVAHLSLQTQADVAASADHTETYTLSLDGPEAYAEKLKGGTPTLCAYTVIEKATHKRTDYLAK